MSNKKFKVVTVLCALLATKTVPKGVLTLSIAQLNLRVS